MKFKLNNSEWEIIECESDSDNLFANGNYRHGTCCFERNTIYIWRDLRKDRKISTLIHELTHAHIEAYGFYSFEEFNHEQICEFNAAHVLSITKIAQEYFTEVVK